MSERRGRSPVAADHRSVLPSVAGIPWWGAVVLAVTAAAVGFAYDAGSGGKTLSAAFSLCYALGCIAAVLLVRQSGVFTAVIQPPLILFVAVPGSYFVLTGGAIKGIKDVLINCGYPLIERFPLMIFTSGIVLVIGIVRWYFSAAAKRGLADGGEVTDAAQDGRLAAAATTMIPAVTPSPRRSRKTATARSSRAAPVEAEEPRRKSARTASGTSRSRHNRPPDTEIVEPAAVRAPRRPRSSAPVDPPIEPRRRIRSTPPEPRRTPSADRRNPNDRPERSERPVRAERPDRYDRPERGERRRRPSEYDPYEGQPPSGANGRNGSGGTHHPVSRVRYRAGDDDESHTQHRSRPRHSEYDS